jgi:hypothetical protein
MRRFTTLMLTTAVASLTLVGCQSGPSTTTTAHGAAENVSSVVTSHDHFAAAHVRPGYITFEDEGRLWVFAAESKGVTDFLAHGEPAKSVTWIGEGPGGMSLKSDEADTMLGYIASKPGYRVFVDDGRLWVFNETSDALKEYLQHGEPAKSVTWIGEGPRGATLRSDSAETLLAYLAAKPGYREFVQDGRVWIFKADSKELAEFLKHGEPAKSVTWIGEGPRGTTLRSESAETLLAYLAAKPGYAVFIEDGRVWVFREGSKELAEFEKFGEPAKSVTRIGEGPRGATIRSDSTETLMAYLAR